MTPQEHELVDALFDRLAKLENAPRDPDAERLIADGARRAPHGVYALVQTALVQDEALKRANARIEELQMQSSGGEPPQQQQPSFLDGMREAVFGRSDARGSVPTVHAQSMPPAARASGYAPESGYAPPPQPPYPAGPAFGGGGSFLGTAASTAAGMIGGGLLLDGIRSMFGHRLGETGSTQSAFGGLGDRTSPWDRSAGDSDLARQAGIDSIGKDHSADVQPAVSSTDAPNTADDDWKTDDANSDDTPFDDDSSADQDSDFDGGGDGGNDYA